MATFPGILTSLSPNTFYDCIQPCATLRRFKGQSDHTIIIDAEYPLAIDEFATRAAENIAIRNSRCRPSPVMAIFGGESGMQPLLR
jgi:hypothetical protein